MADIIQIRRDTASNWTSANPTLAQGEMGYETDTDKVKIGDGSTAWTSLGYVINTGSYLTSSDIGSTVQGYSAVLAGTTASFTTADETKLDGIETGATADQTAAEILTAVKTVDGAASGLDADLLDGQEGSYYTGYTDTAISNLVDTAPSTLDTLNELAAALGDDANFSTTVTNSIATKLPLAGGTMTGNLSFGDNDKTIFGAGSDLQIYHDGSNSYIKDAGTGHLQVWANDLRMSNAAGTKSFLYANDGGATVINYDGSQKLATTSTGIDVTGTVTCDGLTSSADLTIDENSPTLYFLDANGTDDNFIIGVNAGTYNIQSRTDAGTNTTHIQLAKNGDISFYEDTGTTPKFFWDASAESLGIGTSSPSAILETKNTTDGSTLAFQATNDNDHEIVRIGAQADGDGYLTVHGQGASTNIKVQLHSDGDSYFTGGNVGIGTASPSTTLDVNGTAKVTRAYGTLTTDNDLSFDMNASNQFKCTPAANGTLTFTNITSGQSGNIFLVNSGGYAISAAATTYISAADLSAISTAGSYFLSYFSDGTNVMVSASAAVTSAGA
jgi:hypothetical protein